MIATARTDGAFIPTIFELDDGNGVVFGSDVFLMYVVSGERASGRPFVRHSLTLDRARERNDNGHSFS